MNTITIDDISNVSIQVTEEIKSKYLHSFLKTSILNNSSKLSQKTYYSFFYNEKTKTYEILYFEYNEESNIEIFDVIEKFNHNDNIVKVLIDSTYFIVSKNDKLLAFKKITDVKIDEIKLYIRQMYGIEEFECIKVTEENKSCPNKANKNKDYEYYSLYTKKSFFVFCLFFIISFFLFIATLYFESTSKNKELDTSIKREYINTNSRISISKKTIQLFEAIKENNILIEQVTYSNNQIKTIMYHKTKSALLEFTQKYNDKSNIELLKYNSSKKMYQMEISFEYQK